MVYELQRLEHTSLHGTPHACQVLVCVKLPASTSVFAISTQLLKVLTGVAPKRNRPLNRFNRSLVPVAVLRQVAFHSSLFCKCPLSMRVRIVRTVLFHSLPGCQGRRVISTSQNERLHKHKSRLRLGGFQAVVPTSTRLLIQHLLLVQQDLRPTIQSVLVHVPNQWPSSGRLGSSSAASCPAGDALSWRRYRNAPGFLGMNLGIFRKDMGDGFQRFPHFLLRTSKVFCEANVWLLRCF